MNDRAPAEILAEQLRNAELPRAMRGFQEDATRQLLEDAALSVETLSMENARLRQSLNQVEATLEEQQLAVAERVEPEATIQRALLAAARSAEELLSEARQEADDLMDEARRAAEARVSEATVEAEKLVEDTRGALESELQRLEDDRSRLEQERTHILEEAHRAAEEARQLTARELDTVHGQAHELLEGAAGFHATLRGFCTQAEEMLAAHRALQADRPTDGGAATVGSHADDFPLDELAPPVSEMPLDVPAAGREVID